VAGEAKQKKHNWYFLRTALLAIPWNNRDEKDPKGMKILRSYLISASSLSSASKKARRILETTENLTGSTAVGRPPQKVAFKAVGILNLEQIEEAIESGSEIFEEIQINTKLSDVASAIMTDSELAKEVKKENRLGPFPPIQPYWGDDFDELV
jgi:hypothetical protein